MSRWPALALALALGSCNRPATQIVLRVDSDMRAGDELQRVRVTLRREGASSATFDQSFDLTAGTLTLPGTVGVVPGDPDDPRRLEVEAQATLSGSDGFSTRATVSFQREQTLFLELFLASRCRDPANRAGCGPDETCGPDGCEPVTRAMLPSFTADVPRREISEAEATAALPDLPDPLADAADDTLDAGDADDLAEASDIVDDLDDTPDVIEDLPPPCGMPGAACCAGTAACVAGSACVAARCESCGQRGQPCCPMTGCATALRCVNAACAACGGDGEPCCEGNACAVGSCVANLCGPCGARGQRCCANNDCAAGSACVAGVCSACGGEGQPCCAGSACGNRTTCIGGTCAACGANGQPCCGGGCDASTTCSGGRCVPCGAIGQPCCVTLFCGAGAVCSGLRCVACGGNNEPCCGGGACSPTGNPCVTVSCAAGTCRHGVAPNGTQAGAPSQRCCGGALVDIATNPFHCGGCGMACATGSCEPASAIPCGGGGLTGRCRCNGANLQCPVGGGGRRQVCRGVSPHTNRCAPENVSACAAGTSFVDVSSCPNYCRY